jgi:hypothetical protein
VRSRRRRAIDDRRNDTGPQEGEGSEQTDVPFALASRSTISAKDAMRPSLNRHSTHPRSLGDGGEESIRLSGFIVGGFVVLHNLYVRSIYAVHKECNRWQK